MKSYRFTIKATVNFDAGDEVIMSIAGHVSRDRLSHTLPRPDGGEAARPR